MLCKVAKVLISQKCLKIVHHHRRTTLASGIFILSILGLKRGPHRTRAEDRGRRTGGLWPLSERKDIPPRAKQKSCIWLRGQRRYQKVEVGRDMGKNVEGKLPSFRKSEFSKRELQ